MPQRMQKKVVSCVLTPIPALINHDKVVDLLRMGEDSCKCENAWGIAQHGSSLNHLVEHAPMKLRSCRRCPGRSDKLESYLQ